MSQSALSAPKIAAESSNPVVAAPTPKNALLLYVSPPIHRGQYFGGTSTSLRYRDTMQCIGPLHSFSVSRAPSESGIARATLKSPPSPLDRHFAVSGEPLDSGEDWHLSSQHGLHFYW